MKRYLVLFAIAALFAPNAASAEDYSAFRGCVEEVEAAAVTATFHHCTARIAAPCGASANAKEAAECIDAKRAGVESAIASQIAKLAATENAAEAEVRDALDANRSAGDASCAMMAQQDITKKTAIGQRAVNAAFCRLIVSGDVLGMAYRLETSE